MDEHFLALQKSELGEEGVVEARKSVAPVDVGVVVAIVGVVVVVVPALATTFVARVVVAGCCCSPF
jgi:uncharacterized membrane protein HdeD (DUF308 family)